MSGLVLHDQTKQQLDKLALQPAHAILLTGPAGIGKSAIAMYVAELLLELPGSSVEKYPHVRFIRSAAGRSIGIDEVRELEHFLALKIPGNKQVARVAIIEDAHLLTIEAQNALLKTLEEPPNDTVLLLTTAHEQSLLPTIRSRVRIIAIQKPKIDELSKAFIDVDKEELRQALAISGGLPGLTTLLLSEEAEHPLLEAVRFARELLQKSAYERLLMVDELAKRKDLARDVCYILGHMAQMALTKSGTPRWQAIMKAAYETEEALANSAQPKLALTNLMLQL